MLSPVHINEVVRRGVVSECGDQQTMSRKEEKEKKKKTYLPSGKGSVRVANRPYKAGLDVGSVIQALPLVHSHPTTNSELTAFIIGEQNWERTGPIFLGLTRANRTQRTDFRWRNCTSCIKEMEYNSQMKKIEKMLLQHTKQEGIFPVFYS